MDTLSKQKPGSRRRTPEPSGPQQRTDNIYHTIRNRICTSRYPPDTTLHEEDIAREFSVSRSPIRRVFAKLEHEGLIEIRHGVGTRVTAIDPSEFADIYDVRMTLAAATGPHFVKPLGAAEADLFERHKAAFRALEPGDVHGFADANLAYYIDLTGLVTNDCLRALHRQLFFSTSRMWLIQLPTADWSETIGAVAVEVDEIMRAIRYGDPVALAMVMRNNLAYALKRFQTSPAGQG